MARAPRLIRPAASGVSYVAYYRVSTEAQGRSGLGLDAQRAAVAKHVSGSGVLAAEFQEVESGKRNARPQLAAALAACRARRAVLVIAKVDRLARNARFLLSVVEGVGDAGVVFCDLPQIPPGPMGRFFLTLMAAVAELEAGLISQRTVAALAAARARGVRLGGPNLRNGDSDTARSGRASQTRRADSVALDVLPYVIEARRAGATSLRAIGAALTARGIRTPSGGETWEARQVSRIIQRTRG